MVGCILCRGGRAGAGRCGSLLPACYGQGEGAVQNTKGDSESSQNREEGKFNWDSLGWPHSNIDVQKASL